MNYRFLGYNRLSGKSKKTGNDFDFYTLDFAVPYDALRNPRAVGDQACQLNCSPAVFQEAQICPSDIGCLFDIRFDRFGRVEALLPLK